MNRCGGSVSSIENTLGRVPFCFLLMLLLLSGLCSWGSLYLIKVLDHNALSLGGCFCCW